MQNKIIKKILFIIIIIVTIIIINPDFIEANSHQDDEFLIYSFERVNSSKTKLKELNLYQISKLFIKKGSFDQAYQIFKLLSDEYYKYLIICDLMDSDQISEEKKEKIIEQKLEKGIVDETYQIDILFKKLVYFARNNNKSKYSHYIDILKKYQKEIILENLSSLIKLANILSESILKKEYNALKRDIEFYISNSENLNLKINYLSGYFKFINDKKLDQQIEKIALIISKQEDFISRSEYTINFVLALFNIDQYELAQKYFTNEYNRIKNISTVDIRLNCLNEIMKYIHNKFIFNILNNFCDLEDELINHIDISASNITEDKFTINTIEFLIKKGEFTKALKLLNRINLYQKSSDSKRDINLYKDYYNYFIGMEYSKEFNSFEKVFEFEKKIKNKLILKFELIIELIKNIDSTDNEKIYYNILDYLTKFKFKNKWEKDKHLGDLVMICLDNMIPNKASEIINKIEYSADKSILIYELCQYYIQKCQLDKVYTILKNSSIDIHIKAYILSKIASKLFLDGKYEQSEDVFRNAVNTILSTEYGNLEIILNDYYYSRYKGMLIKTKAWNKLNLVD